MDSLNGSKGVDEDTTMNDSNPNLVNDSDALKTVLKDVIMEESALSPLPRSPDLEPHSNVKKWVNLMDLMI